MRPTSITKYQFPICNPIPVSFTKSLARTAAGRIKRYRGTKRVFIEHLRNGGFQYASQIMDINDPLVPVNGPEGKVVILAQNSTITSTDEERRMQMTLPWPQPFYAPPSTYTRYCSTEHSITRGQISLAWDGVQATAQHLGVTNIYFPPDIMTLDYNHLSLPGQGQTIPAAFDPAATHDLLFHIVRVRYGEGYPRYFAIRENLRERDGPEKVVYVADEEDEADDTVDRLQAWYDRYMGNRDRAPEADRHRSWGNTVYGNSEAGTYATGHKVAYCFKIASHLFHLHDGRLTVNYQAPGQQRRHIPHWNIVYDAAGSDTAHVNAFLSLNDLY
ncbi:hypothetical protein FSPOR_1 [Fusarium sporotrichioides]|uniref:Uncharacterized protein n=1 Tax=Fusarium sporotrichioides TaxID=5514 RepID=A0A395SWC5_FUSSP|nr:hypothetical protein FSPOR_1 [Fusarium sporotrichioides]